MIHPTRAFTSGESGNAALVTPPGPPEKERPVGFVPAIGHTLIRVSPDEAGILPRVAAEIERMREGR
ncbi:MAG: hypothetical protein ACP5C4_07670 [Methanomicrobiales archaeon]